MITISSHRRRRGPGSRRNLRSRYEATTLAPRAKQAPRRTPVRWYPIHGYQHDQPSPLRTPSLPMARVLTMKRAPPGPAGVRPVRYRPTKPRAVEGSGSTIARGGAISVPPTGLMARGFAHPGVHEIGDETRRRNGTSDPGVTVLDSGSHINAHVDRPRRANASQRAGPTCC